MSTIALLTTPDRTSLRVGKSLRSEPSGGGYTYTMSKSASHSASVNIGPYRYLSWENIRQTINMTDAELNARFRGTALYVALQSTLLTPHPPAGFVSTPTEAQEVPEPNELALRWPGMSLDDVDTVYRDCGKESKYLAALRLDDMYLNLRELAAEDAGAV